MHEPREQVAPEVVRAERMEGHLHLVARSHVAGILDQSLRNRLGSGRDARHFDADRRILGRLPAARVESDNGIEIGERPEVEQVFEADVGCAQDLGERQSQRAVGCGIKGASVHPVAARARHGVPVQPHRTGGRKSLDLNRCGSSERTAVPRQRRRRDAPPRHVVVHHRRHPVGARRRTDLVEVLDRRIDRPHERPEHREQQQRDDQVKGDQRPAVGLEPDPGILPVRQRTAGTPSRPPVGPEPVARKAILPPSPTPAGPGDRRTRRSRRPR